MVNHLYRLSLPSRGFPVDNLLPMGGYAGIGTLRALQLVQPRDLRRY